MYNQFQIFNLISFIVHYKCPKKGHFAKMGTMTQKVSHLSVHSHLSLNMLTNMTHWTFFLIKWFKKWIFCLVALSLKISRFWIFCLIWFFIKFIQWTCMYFHIKGHGFVVKMFWNQLYDFMHSFLKKCSLNTWYS